MRERSAATYSDSGGESSEAETVILDDETRSGRPRTKTLKRLRRRYESSSDSEDDADSEGRRSDERNHSRRRKQSPGNDRSGSSHRHSREASRSVPPAGGSSSARSSNVVFTKRDANGRLLLQKMCDKGKYDKVKDLLDMGCDVNDRDYAGTTALHDAALKGHLDIVKLLLDHGAIIDIRSGPDDLDTPLIDATAQGHLDVVKLLLARGADPRIYNAQGKTALDFLTPDVENADEIERLLKEAAVKFRSKRRGSEGSNDQDDNDNSWSLDPSKSIPGTFPAPDLHADRKTQPRTEGGSSGGPRRRGARSQSIRNDLLWMDLTTKTGREQVYQKAADGDLQFVGRSLEEGWQPDADCLVLAAKHGHTDVVGLLLAFGVESDAINEDGVTALHETVGRGHVDTIKLLLESGANPNWKDRRGRSYVDLAKEALGSDDEETILLEDAASSKQSNRRRSQDGNVEQRTKKRKVDEPEKNEQLDDTRVKSEPRDASERHKSPDGVKRQQSSQAVQPSSRKSSDGGVRHSSEPKPARNDSLKHSKTDPLPPLKVPKIRDGQPDVHGPRSNSSSGPSSATSKQAPSLPASSQTPRPQAKSSQSFGGESRSGTGSKPAQQPSSNLLKKLDAVAKSKLEAAPLRRHSTSDKLPDSAMRKASDGGPATDSVSANTSASARGGSPQPMQRSSSNEATTLRKASGEHKTAPEPRKISLGEYKLERPGEVKRKTSDPHTERKNSAKVQEDPVAEEMRKRAREKEAEMIKQRERLEQQKQKERKERERQMLRNLEEEERRRELKRQQEREREEEIRRQQAEEEARRKSLEADLELERKRNAMLKRELELRKNYPYAVRATTFGKRPFEEMQKFLPLLGRSITVSSAASTYFLDLQVSLILGFFNIHKVCMYSCSLAISPRL